MRNVAIGHETCFYCRPERLQRIRAKVFGIELASQLIQRKPRDVAKRIHDEVMERIIVVEEIEYDLLLEVAFQTGCRAIDTYYIATASIVDGVLISADEVMVTNARRYGVDAYYIHDVREYSELMTKLQQLNPDTASKLPLS